MSATVTAPPVLARAFKEWAVICAVLESGRQTVLLRKGGLREEDGVFRIDDKQFLLMPTFEHQRMDWIKPEWTQNLVDSASTIPHDSVELSAWAEVETIARVDNDETAYRLGELMATTDEFVRIRLEFNPYDPLYALHLRVYQLPSPVSLPMRPEYIGCRSWVTLDNGIDLRHSVPALSDDEFAARTRKFQAIAGSRE